MTHDLKGFERVGEVALFRGSRPKVVEVAGRRVAVFRRGGRLFAMQEYCPHMGASLAEGRLEGNAVVCAWHGWRFDLDTGGCGRPSGIAARTYDVAERDGAVWLRQRPFPGDAPPEDDEEPWIEWSDDFLKSSSDE